MKVLEEDLKARYRDWNSRITTSSGRKMQEYADRENYELIGPTGPAHYPTNGGQTDVLDIFSLQNTDVDYDIKVTEDLSAS